MICPYCGRPLTSQISRDHIMPRRCGGTDARDNIRLVHTHCNSLREHANDCVGALACAFAVARDTTEERQIVFSDRLIRRVRRVLVLWRLQALR